MTFIPFEVLALIFGISFILPLLGYIYRTAFPMSVTFFLSGAMWLIIFLTTDSIALGETVGNSTTSIIPVTTNHMNQLTSTFELALDNTRKFDGEEIVNDNSVLRNKEINQVTLSIDKDGKPAGKFYVGVWNSQNNPTATNYKFIIGEMIANHTSASPTTYTFTRNDTKTHSLQVNDIIGVYYDAGTATDKIDILENITASSFDGSNTYRSFFSTVWNDNLSVDLKMKASLIEDTAFEDVEITPREYELRNTETLEPTFIGLVFIIFSLSFMIIGILIEAKWTS